MELPKFKWNRIILLLAGRENWMVVTIACPVKDQAVLSSKSFSYVDQGTEPFKQNIF